MSNADSQSTCLQFPGGTTLLIVEDDPSFRRALRRLLELERISVVEAPDAEQAIRVMEQDRGELLDAVLTDLGMPDVSGPELITVLLECRPALPVVAMAGWVQLPPDLPPVPLLRKPFEPEELIETVAPLVLRSQATRRWARQMRADAAESRSMAQRQRTIARDQHAKSGDLMKALMQLRERMTRR
jgi:two-component system C4-dicarboxylate transport response regulator DctD